MARPARCTQLVRGLAPRRIAALKNAAGFGIDDAIDPADSRCWVARLLRFIRPPALRAGKKRPAIDAW